MTEEAPVVLQVDGDALLARADQQKEEDAKAAEPEVKKDPRLDGVLLSAADKLLGLNRDKTLSLISLSLHYEEGRDSLFQESMLDFSEFFAVVEDPEKWQFPGKLTVKVGKDAEAETLVLLPDAMRDLADTYGLSWLRKLNGELALQEMTWKAKTMTPLPLLYKFLVDETAAPSERVQTVYAIFPPEWETFKYGEFLKLVDEMFKDNIKVQRASETSDGILIDVTMVGVAETLLDVDWVGGVRIVCSDMGRRCLSAYPMIMNTANLAVIITDNDLLRHDAKRPITAQKETVEAAFLSVADTRRRAFDLAKAAVLVPFSAATEMDAYVDLGLLKGNIKGALIKKFEKEGAAASNLFELAHLGAVEANDMLPDPTDAVKASQAAGRLLNKGVKYIRKDGPVQTSLLD